MKTKIEMLRIIDEYISEEQDVKVELDVYDDRHLVRIMSKDLGIPEGDVGIKLIIKIPYPIYKTGE